MRPLEAASGIRAGMTLPAEARRRLALDLHHSTAQSLAALAMNLDLVEKRADALDPRARGVLEESRALVQQCFQEVRTVADLLYPSLIDEMGLPLALHTYFASFTAHTGVPVDFHSDDQPRLPDAIGHALFRVVEASLHSASRPVSIHLSKLLGAVHLEIRQAEPTRGRPARPGGEAASSTAELAVSELRDLIFRIGGTFDIDGATIRVRVPIEHART
jgi:signal transduction histidine kinase